MSEARLAFMYVLLSILGSSTAFAFYRHNSDTAQQTSLYLHAAMLSSIALCFFMGLAMCPLY